MFYDVICFVIMSKNVYVCGVFYVCECTKVGLS